MYVPLPASVSSPIAKNQDSFDSLKYFRGCFFIEMYIKRNTFFVLYRGYIEHNYSLQVLDQSFPDRKHIKVNIKCTLYSIS